MYFTMMKNVNWDQIDRTIAVNCNGTTNGVHAILPSMVARGSGHIINITSDAGRKAFAGLAVYSGSKFYIEGMSQALRAETADTGLRGTEILDLRLFFKVCTHCKMHIIVRVSYLYPTGKC